MRLAWLILVPGLAWSAAPSANETMRELAADGVVHLPEAWSAGPAAPLRWSSGHVVRVPQQVHGLPVIGRTLALSLDGAGQVRHLRGEVAGEVRVPLLPTISKPEAIATVDAARGQVGDGELWPSRASLALWFDAHDVDHLVWQVDMSTAKPVATWQVLVDAHSGELLWSVQTSTTAEAHVYGQNPAVSDLRQEELPHLLSDTGLDGSYARVQTCDRGNGDVLEGVVRCYDAVQHATPDDNGDYFYDPIPSIVEDPFAEVNAYFHTDRVAAWYEQKAHYRTPEPVDVFTKLPMANAVWGDIDGDRVQDIALGTAERADYAYDADVIAHELGHGLLGSLWDPARREADSLGLQVNARAMSEGLSDAFALAVNGDPILAESVGGGIRDLEPDVRCPQHLYGESHHDGMVWGSLAWNLMDDPAIGRDATVALLVGTAAGLPGGGTLQEAGDVLAETIEDLYSDGTIDDNARHAMHGHLAASEVQTCERVVPLDDGATSTSRVWWSRDLRLTGHEHLPGVVQYSLTVPPNTEQLALEVERWRWMQGATHDFSIFVRRGQPVFHEVTDLMFLGEMPVPTEYDWVVDGDTSGARAVVEASDAVQLVEGETWYFAVAGRGSADAGRWDVAELTVRGQVVPVSPEAPALGCGCSAAGWIGAWGVAPWFVLLLLRRRS